MIREAKMADARIELSARATMDWRQRMIGESFRFIHAGDFHLEKPLGDLDALPPSLRETMAAAPHTAASAALSAAAVDSVDFVILSGDLLHPQTAGPHSLSLLLDHFETLATKKTPVFWVAGQTDDPARWPDAVPLPPNVHLFPKDRVESHSVTRSGRVIATVCGRSSDGRSNLHVPSFSLDTEENFAIACGYGNVSPDVLKDTQFDYWALGGRLAPKTLLEDPLHAVYCGTPQGRSLADPGRHGYHVVDVDADRVTRPHLVESDLFRYESIDVESREISAVGGIRNAIGAAITRLQQESAGKHLIVAVDVKLEGGDAIKALGDVDSLIDWARSEFGHGNPSAWVTDIRVQAPKSLPSSWSDEDTILGDFLRAADRHRKGQVEPVNLMAYTEESPALAASTASLLGETADSTTEAVLGRATLLGTHLLRGGKPHWKKG
ncbi:MAG: metallophosphoesterase [Planctomycetota bacterium]